MYGRLMWFSTLLDAALHREWIFRIGRLEAIGRIAHLLCETNARLAAVGLAADGRFEFPLTQADIGEACGLTSVHVNRTMRRLRETGLAEIGNREARTEIAAIKVAAPQVAIKVIDRAIQVHGGGGVTEDFPLASFYAHQRVLRLADGPDEVHKRTIAQMELRRIDAGWNRKR